jgi:hypothetical protein
LLASIQGRGRKGGRGGARDAGRGDLMAALTARGRGRGRDSGGRADLMAAIAARAGSGRGQPDHTSSGSE